MHHSLALIIFLAYAPSLGLLWYFYHKDKYEPEPKRYVIMTFVYGALNSVIIAVFFETLLFHLIPATTLTVALIAAVVEEPAKAFVIRVPYNAGQMDGIMDGVVYGVAAGLGFAATENLFYGLGFGTGITIIRALLTPVAHGVWSGTVGVGFGLKSEGKDYLPFLLSFAIVLHFFWNYSVFLAEGSSVYFSAVALLILINLILIFYLMRKGLKEDERRFSSMM